MRRFLIVLASLLLLSPFGATDLEAQKNCSKGKPCGNTCIAKNKNCRVGTGTARPATRTTPAPAVRSAHVPAGMQYVASTRGRTYYHVGCSGWKSLAASNLRWFATREEAVAAGLRPSTQAGCAGPAGATAVAAAQTGPPPAVRGVNFSATCVVTRVTDGDTFACGEERVRMLLIDAPELDQGPYGARSQEALIQLIPAGTHVGLELDVEERDQYGRLLAYVYGQDGQLVNATMVRRGYAIVSVYPPNVKYVDRLRSVQTSAQAARVGLWSGSAFECTPADHRAGRCEL